MGLTHSLYRGNKKCIQNLAEETSSKAVTYKTKKEIA
jgi:hypothetical protein